MQPSSLTSDFRCDATYAGYVAGHFNKVHRNGNGVLEFLDQRCRLASRQALNDQILILWRETPRAKTHLGPLEAEYRELLELRERVRKAEASAQRCGAIRPAARHNWLRANNE